MNLLELFLTEVGLAMDAFAVAICIGLTTPEANFKKALTVGLYFGIFQAMMPLLGYILCVQFSDRIIFIDHWVAFLLLSFIGWKMIKESISQDQTVSPVSIEFKQMIPLAVATSIDALAAGISFAFLKVDIIPAVTFIGLVTLTLSMTGAKVGQVFGARFKARAELVGGVILIFIGLKILFEHTGVLAL